VIDLHSHLFLHPYNETLWNDQVLTEPQDYRTLEAAAHAKATLLAGFTALRDLGTEGAGFADVSIKRAIDNGLIPGPRMLSRCLSPPQLRPGAARFSPRPRPAAGRSRSPADAAVAAVRGNVRRGLDQLYADYRGRPRR
jgi:imidazolonepropionase-like amidohydrolase